ncbi:MAG: DEAD/DEAH box helicase [Halobacteriales archaeon]
MQLRELDLPSTLRDHYRSEGIESLYPPQAAAVEAGITDGNSLVAAVPTASGKTLIATLAMLTAPGMALYVVPLRALAEEKHAEFAALPDVSVGVATGDYTADAEELGDHDIVVATSEKVDSMIRRGVSWLDDCDCLVVDEVHLLDSAARGPTLEITVAKLRRLVPDLQLIALSATVGNPEAIADWLNAGLVESTWRPVELKRGVYSDGTIDFAEGDSQPVWTDRTEPVPALVADTLADGGQCLVFVHSRRAAESVARELSDLDACGDADLEQAIDSTARTATGRSLASTVEDGIAFHHAGLRSEHRSLIERAFRDRRLEVICATPTLASGVNIPARRIIVRDHQRYTDTGLEPLSVLEIQQMFGRAGRPGLDPYGEAVLIADDAAMADRLTDQYINADSPDVTSKLATQEALRTHVLSTIASGFADSRSELLSVLGETFYAAQEDQSILVDIADLLLDYLASETMIDTEDGLTATEYGEQVSRLYIDPRTGAKVVADLRAATELAAPSPLTVLEILCDTPDMTSRYLTETERSWLYRFAMANDDVFVRSADTYEGEFEAWLKTLKSVRILLDWINDVSEDAIIEEYGIGPGDLRLKVERATWLAGAIRTLVELHDLPLLEEIGRIETGLTNRNATRN